LLADLVPQAVNQKVEISTDFGADALFVEDDESLLKTDDRGVERVCGPIAPAFSAFGF
jgi:hypothetical protein